MEVPINNTPLEQDSVLNRVDVLEKKFDEISTSVSQNNIVLTEVLKTLKTIVNKTLKSPQIPGEHIGAVKIKQHPVINRNGADQQKRISSGVMAKVQQACGKPVA